MLHYKHFCDSSGYTQSISLKALDPTAKKIAIRFRYEYYSSPPGWTYDTNGEKYIDNILLTKDLHYGITEITENGTIIYCKGNIVNISSNSTIEQVSIFGINGRMIKNLKVNSDRAEICIDNKGIYIIQSTSNGETTTSKVVVK